MITPNGVALRDPVEITRSAIVFFFGLIITIVTIAGLSAFTPPKGIRTFLTIEIRESTDVLSQLPHDALTAFYLRGFSCGHDEPRTFNGISFSDWTVPVRSSSA